MTERAKLLAHVLIATLYWPLFLYLANRPKSITGVILYKYALVPLYHLDCKVYGR